MTKDEMIRELSDKLSESEFNYSKLLKVHKRLKGKHKNLQCQYEQMQRVNFGLRQTINNLNEKLESYYRSTR